MHKVKDEGGMMNTLKEQVLLLGNGINDVTSHYKWSDLIADLINYAGLKTIRIDEKKPFPLLYEEIYLTNLKSNKLSETKLKNFITQKMTALVPNSVHERISSFGFADIITTNYDYTIEKAHRSSDKADELRNSGAIREKRYSVFRSKQIQNTKIWHVHGEIDNPNSILLGNEHYGGNLQHIRSYVVDGASYSSFKSPSLISLIKRKGIKNYSWVDLIFTRDVHIVGFTLDFIELDLWWLITYRARKKLERALPINNRLTYYYPKEYEEAIRFKLEMLEANEVSTVGIGNKHDKLYYTQVLNHIENEVN